MWESSGYFRWFQPQPIAAEQQMNFPVDPRSEKDNKITVILTHTVWRWAVLFPNNWQPKHWATKDLVIKSRVSLDSLPAQRWRQEPPAVLFQHLIHPHSPTAIAGLTSFPTLSGLQTRTQHNLKQLLLPGQQLAGSPKWTSTGACLFSTWKVIPWPYVEFSSPGLWETGERLGGWSQIALSSNWTVNLRPREFAEMKTKQYNRTAWLILNFSP